MLCLWAFVSCLSQMFCLDRKNAGNPITDYRRIFYVFFDYRFVGYVEIPEVSQRTRIKADTRKGVAVEYLTEPLPA